MRKTTETTPGGRTRYHGLRGAAAVLAAIFILCVFSAVARCETGAGSQSSAPSVAPAAAPAGDQKPAAEKAKTATMEGAVTFKEPDGTLVLLFADRKTSPLYIRKETVITRDGKPATFADIKVGDKVVAKYGGMNVAIEATVTGGGGNK